MRAQPVLGGVLMAMILGACGGGSSTHSSSSTGSAGAATSTTASTSGSASSTGSPRQSDAGASPSCHVFTPADFARVGASPPAAVRKLADSADQRRTCSDLFIDASGGLMLWITKSPGGARELAAAREIARSQSAGARTKPLSLPRASGGFVVGQHAAFLRGGQVVSLNSGFTTGGQPELTTGQLIRLARLAARH